MKDKRQLLQDVYLIILTVGLFLLMFGVISPFFTTLIIAVLIVAIFQPVFKALKKSTNKGIASFLSSLIAVLIVVIPLILISIVIVSEILAVSEQVSGFIDDNILDDTPELFYEINRTLIKINPNLQLARETFDNAIGSAAGDIANFLSQQAIVFLQNAGVIFTQLIVFFFTISLIFRDFDKIPKVLKKYGIMGGNLEVSLYKEFISTGQSLLKGTFFIAIIHAIVNTLILALFGVPNLGLVFTLLFIASLIPGGSQFVWIPVGIITGVNGGWLNGILVLAFNFVAMNLIDTVLRPAVTSSSSKVHPLLSLISVLGGLMVYGIAGLLYGPLIAVFFITIVEIYNKRFKITK